MRRFIFPFFWPRDFFRREAFGTTDSDQSRAAALPAPIDFAVTALMAVPPGADTPPRRRDIGRRAIHSHFQRLLRTRGTIFGSSMAA